MKAGEGVTMVRSGYYAVTIRAMPIQIEETDIILGPVLNAVVLGHPAALVLDLLALSAGMPIPGILITAEVAAA